MAVSVRVRFEVFKRDKFTCQYCGKHPPEVLLEADHIIPRAAGGADDITNLTTACNTCNRGKGARLLEEGTAPVVSRNTVDELAERVEQAKAYMELLGGLQSLVDQQYQMVVAEWAKAFGARTIEEADGTYWRFDRGYGEVWPNEPSVRRFLRSLTLEDVLEAVHIAASRMSGRPGTDATRYFYGICHRAIKQGNSVHAPMASADSDEAALEEGARQENRRLRDLFLNRENYGYESLADVVTALWPEDD